MTKIAVAGGTRVLKVGASLALTLVTLASFATPTTTWIRQAVGQGHWGGVFLIGLLTLGAASGTLVLREYRWGRPLLLTFFALQVPIVHLATLSVSSYVGAAAFLTMDGGNLTVGVGYGGELIFGTPVPTPWPPGIGVNLVALSLLVWLLRWGGPVLTPETVGKP